MSELCPKCKVSLEPVDLRGKFATGRDQYDGSEAEINKLSNGQGLICSQCHDVFGWNGEIKPLRLSLLTQEMRAGVQIVKFWRIDRPIDWPKLREPVQTEFSLD